MEELIQAGILPQLTDYGSYSLGYYRADGTLSSYQAGWQMEAGKDEGALQLTLNIWPQMPQNPEQTGNILLFDPQDLTKPS